MTGEAVFPILLTLRTCLAAVLLFCAAGVPLAFRLGRSSSPASKVISFAVTLPLIFPPIALGYMLLLLAGRNGALGALSVKIFGRAPVFNEAGVFLAAFIAGLPLVVKPLAAAFADDNLLRMEQAARVLGCGPYRTFIAVTLPIVKKTVLTSLLMGLARASGEVGISMMLGGNIANRTNTISLEIFNCVTRGDFENATSLCLLLGAFCLAVYAALELLQKGNDKDP